MLRSQTLINQLWQLELNYPDTVSWSASALNGAYLITTGNTFNGISQKTNIATTKTDQGGAVVWQAEYNGPLSGFDYGAALAVDAAGNVFIAGASHASDAYSFDVVVIKYNAAGVQQWATSFDGEANANDIPSAILLTGTDIYVCAASIGAASNYDYLLLKLNAAGAVLWNARYDYADLDDIPGHIAAAAADIIVSGASQSDTANWDYTSLKYNSSGTLINTKRTAAPGYGFDRPSGLVVDASGNFYISGYAFNGTDYDMRTIKLDDDLSTLWSKTENGGAQDGCNAICMDDGSNIYIAGFSENSAGNKCMQIIKYDSSGTKLWAKTLQNAGSDIRAEVTGITFNSENNKLIATGFYEYPSGKKTITTFALKTANGNINWKKDYPNIAESIDVPTGVLAKNNYVWVNGRRTVEDTTRYVTVKYEMWERVEDYISDTLARPMYVDKQLLVSFDPSVVNLDFVNNKQTQFANLQDVISSSLFNQINPLIKGQEQFTVKSLKIYKRLTANDSLSITRLGDTIPIPKFWSTLLLVINVDPTSVLDTLNNIAEIQYADLNSVFQFDYEPNDLNADQVSLFGGDASTSDVDMDDAWDVELGRTNVKVGVLDAGIYWAHEDFHFTIGDETYDDSKIEGGWDYDNNYNVWNDNNNDDNSSWHGTAVAGILGAVTDNDIGIAGIAGGSYNAADINSTGVQLLDLEIGKENLFGDLDAIIVEDYAAAAILEGATFSTGGDYGFGLHIMNQSWGSYDGAGDMITVGNNIRFAFNNHVITVCSKGNDEDDKLHYPSDFRDTWILGVGGSGFNGNWDDGSDVYDKDGANFGNGIDLVAPYGFEFTDAGFVTLDNSNPDAYWGLGSIFGTSFSAPHVAGTAALMLSQVNHSSGEPHPDNLTHEDVEHILQITADDNFNPPSESGYDDHTGWGLLDAGEALALVDKPHFQIVHVCNEYDVSSIDPEEENIYLAVLESATYYGISPGAYVADRYKATFTSTHTLTPTSEILDYWILPSMSNTLNYAEGGIGVIDDPFFSMTEPALTSTTVTGYFYYLHSLYTYPFTTINKWIPFDPNTTKANFCYSLHIFDEEAIDDVQDFVFINNMNIAVYPNPTKDVSNLIINSDVECDISYSLTNISGTKVGSVENTHLFTGQNKIAVALKDLPSGIYTLSVYNSSFHHAIKIIKM